MCVNVSISVVHLENHHTIPGLTILISKYMYVHNLHQIQYQFRILPKYKCQENYVKMSYELKSPLVLVVKNVIYFYFTSLVELIEDWFVRLHVSVWYRICEMYFDCAALWNHINQIDIIHN